jgi:hypothetical protein
VKTDAETVEAIVVWLRNLAGLPGDRVLIRALADAIERRGGYGTKMG